jgi:hypothetical protein
MVVRSRAGSIQQQLAQHARSQCRTRARRASVGSQRQLQLAGVFGFAHGPRALLVVEDRKRL